MAHLKQNQMFKLVFHELEILVAQCGTWRLLLWLPRHYYGYLDNKVTLQLRSPQNIHKYIHICYSLEYLFC